MGHGVMSATESWSGHYRVQPTLYAVAHTTQFTHINGCRYVKNDAVGMHGWLDGTNTSTIVGFRCGDSDWSVVIETSAASQHSFSSPTIFQLRGVSTPRVTVWMTNASHYFQRIPEHTLWVNHSVIDGDNGHLNGNINGHLNGNLTLNPVTGIHIPFTPSRLRKANVWCRKRTSLQACGLSCRVQ